MTTHASSDEGKSWVSCISALTARGLSSMLQIYANTSSVHKDFERALIRTRWGTHLIISSEMSLPMIHGEMMISSQ